MYKKNFSPLPIAYKNRPVSAYFLPFIHKTGLLYKKSHTILLPNYLYTLTFDYHLSYLNSLFKALDLFILEGTYIREYL